MLQNFKESYELNKAANDISRGYLIDKCLTKPYLVNFPIKS